MFEHMLYSGDVPEISASGAGQSVLPNVVSLLLAGPGQLFPCGVYRCGEEVV